MGEVIRSFRDLRIYQRAFRLQQEIFRVTQGFPREERYALSDQMRRASRSIGANLAEAWARRRYEAHFLSKLCDCDGEQAEVQHWLDTAQACDYLSPDQHALLTEECREIGRMLGTMMANPSKFCPK
ncbi:MAG: four helix bundle protein [Verrucomicrobiae bacterium]|nr:four helix bundle protein [Verrucomicrobiae bacterium]